MLAIADTAYRHIAINNDDVPIIATTNMKVVELVLSQQAYGWSPEELHFQYPHLTLGQIYSALAYYADHVEDFQADIEQRLQKVDALRHTIKLSSLPQRLRAKGLL